MITHAIIRDVLIAFFALLFMACGWSPTVDEPPTAAPTATLEAEQALPTATPVMRIPTPTPAPLHGSVFAASAGFPSGFGQIGKEIPPCTPAPGSLVDPCEAGYGLYNASSNLVSHVMVALPPDVPYSVGDYLDGFGWWENGIGHIVVRGTYLPGTVRCTSGNRYLTPSWNSDSLFADTLFLYCFADVRVNEYIIGTGPSVLTVIVVSNWHSRNGKSDYEPVEIETLRTTWERALTEGGEQRYKPFVVTGPDGGITGREAILFLSPSSNAFIETWMVRATWDVRRHEDGTVVAVHPNESAYLRRADYESLRPQLEMELPAFERAVTTAHQARVAANGGRIRPEPNYPMLVTDANKLESYFREVGAYDDPDNPPAQPPPA